MDVGVGQLIMVLVSGLVSLPTLPGCHYPNELPNTAWAALPNKAYSKHQGQFYCSQAYGSSYSHSYCVGQLYFFFPPLWWPQGQLSYLLQLVMGECIFASRIPACGRWENHFSQTYHLNGDLSLALWDKLVSSKMNSSSQDGIDLDCTLVFRPKECVMQWTWPVFVNFWCWLPPKFTEHCCTKLPSNFLNFFPTIQVMCVILSAKTGNWKSDFKKNIWDKDGS